ncbi:hypothetical protein A1O1_00087 [Capronia coronata CBS 617.96]|uniref:Uncharacterized protein n=1 Tax=Capronia coronata CBS 617.96 TaxID=1182541 RepID=W9ZKE0_9EURO|nr:uncharacterized protein A1O1_00087 [Capronia coronata CBS 617.96]EXJ94969.1 hypothetical protein A1O1_00087 [Capronia coronata CBS 617.96]
MSDLTGGYPPGTIAASGRTQNGGATRATAAAGTGPIPAEPPRYRTPTDVMRERRAREARKAEEAAARLRQEEERRLRQEEQVVGVGDDPTRRVSAKPAAQSTQAYNIGGPSTQVPSSSARRQENVPPTQTGASRQSATYARPVQSGGRGTTLSAATQRNRTEAYEQLNIPAIAKPTGQPEQIPRATQQNQPPPQPSGQPSQPGEQLPGAGGRRGFPSAFERWEDLSSHWEGIVSSFIHRLQNNADELAGKPLERQMARQIEDLSAAGANLFHAVVELQRLRASSERKFQRWFFETRHEQEQAQERQAELERQLRAEREARTQSSASIDAVRAEKARAGELVKEMRRELQISKEEARRAWEELGRREQEERERTISLRSGEPTLIGGVQVVPMQGLVSRQVSSAQRPQTRTGPAAGAGPTVLSGQEPQQQQQMHGSQQPPSRSQTTTTSLDSPGEESRQFSYQPDTAHSPTITDPFTDTSRARDLQSPHLRHEPDTQFYATSPRHTQPHTSAAAIAAARAATVTAGAGPSPGRGPSEPRFHPQATPGGLPVPMRSGTGDTEQSYIASTASGFSEEEYHINPDGSYRLDERGRRIPYRQPVAPTRPARPIEPEGEEEDISDDERGEQEIGEVELSDDDDHTADVERERMYSAQYRQGQPQQQPSRATAASSGIPRTTSGALPTIPQGQPVAEYEEGDIYESPTVTQATANWENIRHRHPTRLSDIIEEQTAHTSPSRASHVSASGAGGSLSSGQR